MVLISINPDTPSEGYRLRHRRGKSETLRAQYINTKDVRFGDNLPMLSIRSTILVLSGILMTFNLLQGDNWYLECCWKSSR